jgi:hypothetical protein
MTGMILTDEETRLVLEYRKEQAAIAMRKQMTGRLLRIAANYYDWLQQQDAGDTYTTFCNDFGYEARCGESRPEIHGGVAALIRTSKALANDFPANKISFMEVD